ncbi:MAG: four helix bundle protein [Flavobacteriales bacterium]|nr:four helix bundle protein [Flavobacteriales bacterium]MCB9190960.1 four helix bundle protein [Flavobacteriales bacterium]MCB9204805.1 four helix bundle protein [Flavobacteriales bacterium]
MKKGWPHKNLMAWQESMELVRLVYVFALELPSEEKFNIISQLKRAAVSIPLNIAEGAGRNTDSEFKHFLHIARGSLSEVNTVLDLCVLLDFCNSERIRPLNEQEQKCAALLNGLIKSLDAKTSS